MQSALTFAGLCLLLSIVPGPDSLLVLRLSLDRPRAGVMVAVGSSAGSLCWAMAVGFGLAGFISSRPGLVTVLHVLGGVYLVYLGISELARAPLAAEADEEKRSRAERSALTMGLVSCLLNPKVGLFFLLVAPQYAPALDFGSIMMLGVIDALVAFVWLAFLSVTAAAAVQRLASVSAQRRLRLVSGLAIAAIGAMVLVQSLV
ncbi:LysE family translocator [Tsukamurella paurometabola]|nr:LysE family translocator [Tsukamurella paurometabola]